jgi:NADH-quinone oxidoreductase subunit L
MISEVGVWAMFFLPLGTCLIIALIVRPFFNRYRYVSSQLLICALVASMGLAVWTLRSVVANGGDLTFAPHHWLTVGDVEINIGLMVDSLTAIMLIVVIGVSLMVQIYSHGYMKHDPGYARYYAFMGLFTASMIGLVQAANIIQLYVFWELVGLSSYLLIGFWFHRPAAAAAAKKAFIVTRIGDFGFLLAIMFLFLHSSDYATQGLNFLDIGDIQKGAALGVLGGVASTWLALGIFAGAIGKSGQFPLHVWLPDAMEGPTPVSALIHAATMVAAGVFLVARFYPVFEVSQDAMTAVAIVGTFTAIFAATMALVMNDMKRVLAYSTISQLGYMIAALGLGAYGVAVFHLFNHAFFKALLFLGAGNVNHATGTFDMRYMGGLWRRMPITYVATLIGALSLVGIFPLAGFWSKDEILHHAWEGLGSLNTIVFWTLLVGVFLTAAYTFRMVLMTFHGEFKGGIDREMAERTDVVATKESHLVHLAESPLVMVLPMVVLAVAAIASGYLANPASDFMGINAHWFTHFVVPPNIPVPAMLGVNLVLAAVVMAVGIAGICVAIWQNQTRYESSLPVVKSMVWIQALVSKKYYVDHFYEGVIVRRGLYRSIAAILDWFDRSIVDGVADFVGLLARNVGRAVSLIQTGQVQVYGIAIVFGVVAILTGYLVWG